MKPERSREPRGIALVIVMISIFVLSILAGGFAYSMKIETRLARNASNESELEWMGRSTVEYARWVLANSMMDPRVTWDSLDQPWATGVGLLGPTNAPIAEVQNPLKFRNGTATWKIVDLERKINVNTANEIILQQVLMTMGLDAGSMTPIINCILDWIDRDNMERVEGAENGYYNSLMPYPYDAKNGPIDNLSELLMIKGITPDLYWGITSTNHPPGVFLQGPSRLGAPTIPNLAFGLVDVLTPLSIGRVNINTAPLPVLQVLLGGDAAIAQRLIEVRSGGGGGPEGMNMPIGSPGFSIPDALVSAGLSRMAAMAIAPNFVTRSATFQVTVDAQINGYHRNFVAVVGRNNNRDLQVLNFYWKD